MAGRLVRKTPRRAALLALAGAGMAIALNAARASDPPGTDTVREARAAFESAYKAFQEWGREEPRESPLRREARDLPASSEEAAAFPDRVPAGMAADAAAQPALADADAWIVTHLAAIQAHTRAVISGEPEEAQVSTATPASPDAVPERTDAVLDVRAIVRTPPDLPAPSCGLRRYDPTGGIDGLVEMHGQPRSYDLTKLAGTLGDLVKEDEGSFVEQLDGALVVHASPLRTARCRALVALLREASAARVALDVRSYRMTRELFLDLASLSSGVALLPEGERMLEKEAQEGKRASLLAAQTTVAQDGQIVHVFQGESRAYLSGFEVNQTGLTPVVDPVSSRLTTGFVAELRPCLSHDRRSVKLDAAVVLSRPTTPCEKQKVQGVELELPEVSLGRASTTVVVPLGSGALIAGTFVPSSAAAGELDLPLACVAFVKATAFSGQEPPRAPDGAARSTPRPIELPQGPGDLAEDARAELARLSKLARVLEARLALVRAARVYRFELADVRDLVDGRHDRAAPALGLPGVGIKKAGYRPLSVRNPVVVRPGQGGFAAPQVDATDETDRGEGAITEDKLDLLVRSMTGGDDAWREPAVFDFQGGSALILQTPGMLARADAVLGTLRKAQSKQIKLEAGLYRLDSKLLSELGLDSTSPNGGSLPESALGRLDEAAAKGERATWLGGGFLIARNGERVYLHEGHERAYLSGFESSSGGSGSVVEKVTDPVVAILRTGITLDVRATWDEDAWPRLTVEATVARARLRSLGRDETTLGVVTTPSLDMESSTASGALGDGAGLVVLARRPDEKKQENVLGVVVRPRVY